ncbi:MAG: manganese-binding transcriptional regulator MntR [Planctomycetaceae bacterium]|nr:manganese-binding transcriptional regulator MntR [Planctomycetaceae bacterium]
MKKPARINRHTRTRDDHASETAEDYVEAVAELVDTTGNCRVIDLAQHFQVSSVTVSKIISRLNREGYVETKPYGPISLSVKGRKLASHCRKRHDVVHRFLLALGVSEQTAVIDSEGIEHHVSKETLRCMQEFIDQAAQS